MSSDQWIILWTGPRHSGKTTTAQALVDLLRGHGWRVAGLLAPCVMQDGRRVGYDALDIVSGRRAALLRPAGRGRRRVVGRFACRREGLRVGGEALRRAADHRVDLVVVDEFGPLELDGAGWRRHVEQLVRSPVPVLVLVVREELVEAVMRLYPARSNVCLSAGRHDSLARVEACLHNCSKL